jgi:hypothetical protein
MSARPAPKLKSSAAPENMRKPLRAGAGSRKSQEKIPARDVGTALTPCGAGNRRTSTATRNLAAGAYMDLSAGAEHFLNSRRSSMTVCSPRAKSRIEAQCRLGVFALIEEGAARLSF